MTPEQKARLDAALAERRALRGPGAAEPPQEPEGDGIGGMIDTANTAAGHVVENLMMGYGDEAAAGLGAGIDWLLGGMSGDIGEMYDENLNRSRAKMDEFRERNPELTTALEVAGGVAPAAATMGAAMGPAMVAKGARVAGGPRLPVIDYLLRGGRPAGQTTRAVGRPSISGRIARGTAAGAGYGGAYGYGAGRGGHDARMEAMTDPAMFGAGIGAAVPVVGAVARPVAARAEKWLAARQADVPMAAFDPVQEALEKNVKTPTGVAPAGKPGSLNVDTAPELQALTAESLGRLGRFGGKARETLEGRSSAAMDAPARFIDEAMDTTPAGLKTIVRRMDAQDAEKIDAAYKTAYSRPVEYVSPEGEALADLIQNRVPPEAIREAQRLMRVEGVKPQWSIKGVEGAGDDAVLIFEKMPSVQEIDYITRAMNDMAEATRNPKTDKLTGVGRAVRALSSDIRGALREAVPEWGTAVDLAKRNILPREMVEFGESVLSPKTSVSDVNAMIARKEREHPGFRDTIRQSIAQGLRNNIDNVVSRAKTPLVPELGQSGFATRGAQRDPEAIRTLKELSSSANREKIAAIIGEERASVLFTRLDEAAKAIEVNEAMGDNMRAAAKEMLDAQVRRDERGLVGNVVRGKPRDALGIVFDRVRGEKGVRRPDPTAKAVVDYLLQRADPVAMTRVLQTRHRSERGLKGAKRAEQAAGGAGLAVGMPLLVE